MSSTPTQGPDVITVAGKDLVGEVLDHYGFTDMIHLVLTKQADAPPGHIEMLDALLVTFTDHGTTPSSMAARLTLLGAPEAMQAAVAAGLCGAGSRFLGTLENSAEQLATAVSAQPASSAHDIAGHVVAESRSAHRTVVGIGHPEHKREDPRVPKLLEIARRHHLAGQCTAVLLALPQAMEDASGTTLPVNAAGLAGALLTDMGYSPSFARGIAVIARAAGLVGQLLDEEQSPIARQMWDRERADPSTTARTKEST